MNQNRILMVIGAVFSALMWLGCVVADGDAEESSYTEDAVRPCGKGNKSNPCDTGSASDGSSTDDSSTDDDGSADSGSADSGSDDGGSGGIATQANLKVAFIGDTATGSAFRNVLALVRREGAHFVMIQGDLTYGGATGSEWFSVIDNEINKDWPGSTASVTIPYFVSKGNHDVDWNSTLGPGLRDRMTRWGITPENNDPTKPNYSVVYRGLKMVIVTDSETSPTRASYIDNRLTGDQHIWKVCSWHKNQRATNVATKGDEMGWQVYETCRMHGAIVAQGHSHTYSRSKTIINDTLQTVDPTCSSPFDICISRGRHIFLDSSLGGRGTRTLDSTWSAKPYWASTYSGSYGALFVDFNVDGNPRKARGYFKTTGNTIIDPPASSGLTSFVMTSTD
jgi:hypothetical protein